VSLSTCARCAGTIERRPGSVAGWGHVAETARNVDGHLPEPDDSAVAGPDRCDECGAVEGDDCEADCDCSACENERALDEDADAYAGRLED
jgi:hypothetical protein